MGKREDKECRIREKKIREEESMGIGKIVNR